MRKCSQCSSNRIVHNLRVLDQVNDSDKSDLALEANLDPQALFLKNSVTIPMVANVCVDCGNVDFSIRDQADLERIQQAAQAAAQSEAMQTDEDEEKSIGFGTFLGKDSKS